MVPKADHLQLDEGCHIVSHFIDGATANAVPYAIPV